MGSDSVPDKADVVVIGGGPAGSTIATLLAQRGWQVILLEKDRHPRFHIGESLLPLNLPIFEQLGVQDDVRQIGLLKPGIEMASDQSGRRAHTYYFENTLDGAHPHAFQVRRSEFDHLLLENSKKNGALVLEEVRVQAVETRSWGDNRVTAETADGREMTFDAGVVVDASGRNALLATRKGLKVKNPRHNSSALFGHFENAERFPGRDAGNIGIYWFPHGWFWMIPLRDGAMSVGAVCWPEYLKTRKGPLDEFFQATIALCPGVQERLAKAHLVSGPQATGNYSYKSQRMWGPGYVLVGDAYAFVDPVFSSGVYLAMSSAVATVDGIEACLREGAAGEKHLDRAQAKIDRGLKNLSWFIYRFTTPAIHNLFLAPRNILRMEEAILALLAGDIFSKGRLRLPIYLFKAIYLAASAFTLRRSLRSLARRKRNVKLELSY